MKVFITGGCGFVGEHTAAALLEAGHQVFLYDSLFNSCPETLEALRRITGERLPFEQGDIRNGERLLQTLKAFGPDVVFHFAAFKSISESFQKPLDYYDVNVSGTLTLLKAMRACGLKRLVFSSTVGVYPENAPSPCPETVAAAAPHPYGETKVMIERLLSRLGDSDPDLSSVILRFCNPAGAHPSGLLGEKARQPQGNLFPRIWQAARGELPQVEIFGGDYPTPDGTAVRDYLHIMDLAEGCVKAAEYSLGHQGTEIFNLGSGAGASVLSVLRACERAAGRCIPFRIARRRPGDRPEFIAATGKAESILGWKARRGLDEICQDAWRYESHRN
ncbi:UDP-glucose 4-epimerase GalE [Mesosutterella sp. AGMB02718]|uniref:UDP-glucose 4-epimerase n=1 Tax=Mesosutterella faecium TaxID=2925194 RepID=A0ABT7IMA1_9BURK|nr:UDP-glucose 4-epimerase GalE [Mesosutterella sp. AGMB02718]MDL2059497.1 UDP-glucose 4-epimerase GalE [Mesosutterella sp. AGMB02718]